MIYTGGHDGSIIAWNFETGYFKYKLHDLDKTCTSDEFKRKERKIKRRETLENMIVKGKTDEKLGDKINEKFDDNGSDDEEVKHKLRLAAKSVDAMVILEKKDKLLTMSADQYLRFWNILETQDGKQPSFKKHCKHSDDGKDGLSAIAVSKDNDFIVTGDTSGQLKLWDVSQVDFDKQEDEKNFIEKYFIIAHSHK